MNVLNSVLWCLVFYVSMAPAIQASENKQHQLLKQAQAYKAQGELLKAYALLNKTPNINTALQLQLALLADLLGKERQANNLFEGLLANKKTSSEVKDNIIRFRLKFAVSLQLRLKQAQVWSKQGQCGKAITSFQYLLAFNKTRKKSAYGLKECQLVKKDKSKNSRFTLIPLGLKGKFITELGQDSNVRAENQELLSGNDSLLTGVYQTLKMNLAYNWRTTMMSNPISLSPSFSYSQKRFSTTQANAYDRDSKKFQLKIVSKNPHGLVWRLYLSEKTLTLGGHKYASYQQVSPSLSWPQKIGLVQGNSRIRWQVKQRKYEDPLYHPRNGVSHALDYQLGIHISQNIKIKPAIWYRHQSTRSDDSRVYDGAGIKLSAILQQDKLHYSLGYQYGYFVYGENTMEPQANKINARENHRWDIRGTVGYQIIKNWQASLQMNYAQQSSNQTLYEFDRFKSALGISFKF